MSRYLVTPTFDGASDARSRNGSQHSGHPSQYASSQAPTSRVGGSSHPRSNIGAAAGPVGYPTALGFDPARESPPIRPEDEYRNIVGKRVDLPAEAFAGVCARYIPLHCHANTNTLIRKTLATSIPSVRVLVGTASLSRSM